MKKIIAIIRNECVEQSRSALEKIGINGVVVLHVRAQSHQKSGICDPHSEKSMRKGDTICPVHRQGMKIDTENTRHSLYIESELEFLPKTMLIMAVTDEKVHPVVHALIQLHLNIRHGDGAIFVCPMVTAIGIGTGNHGDKALS